MNQRFTANLFFLVRKQSSQTTAVESKRPDWAAPKKVLSCQSATESAAMHPTAALRKKQPFYAPYLALTKPRLTALVVLSAMCPYALTPNDATLSQLLFLTLGTALCSGSANAINMAREWRWDAMMTRTRTRPVVRGLVSSRNAFIFAGAAGAAGAAALYFGVNPTVAALGALNIALYGGLYTTLKRRSISNTWVGAVVGAIPPLMGWAASSSLAEPGAWLLAGLLYAWQFPHFMALSHNIRDEYRRAGYVMAAWTNPALNARVALRYSVLMFPLCIGLSYFGVTDNYYILTSSILNGWLTICAYRFWKEQRYVIGPVSTSGAGSVWAKQLFWGSVLHLPGVLILAILHKKGQWDWLFGSDEEEF
ncbi:protoheme IX farnesyltransferase, mitochondrial [Trichomonascus vanleenenianus]|uniref:protoheme IX farnesyltransferase n=1 Tax=Trichomonascus vanleenenianus TaxID=2268995 RepID=UPI003ECA2BE9